MDRKPGKVILKGITRQGRKFRPSDWAQRLTTAVASFEPGKRSRRAGFHPRVQMATIDGVNCVVIDEELKSEDPMLFEFLMNFGNGNNLEIVETSDQNIVAETATP